MEVNGIKIVEYTALNLGNKPVQGQYMYDDVHKRHYILYCGMHGITEAQIDPTTLAIKK